MERFYSRSKLNEVCGHFPSYSSNGHFYFDFSIRVIFLQVQSSFARADWEDSFLMTMKGKGREGNRGGKEGVVK